MERGGVSFAQEHFINNSCADNNVRQCMSISISHVLLTDIRRDRFPFKESGIPLFSQLRRFIIYTPIDTTS